MSILHKGIKTLIRKSGLLQHFHHLLNRINPTFESIHPANLPAISQALREGPAGDYYEFGVYKGFSLWYATQIASCLKKDIRFFGFDSFDGLPEPVGVDKEPDAAGNTFARGCFCAGQRLVESFLIRYGSDMSKVSLIPGFFDKVLTDSLLQDQHMRAASVILIDCDMYDSTRTVLHFIPHILQPGTIILFDDWLLTDEDKGQQKAFREWKETHTSLHVEPFCDFPGGKGFRVIRL